MTDAQRSKTPKEHPKAKPPETHEQTQPLEETIDPAHHVTESYGKGELKNKLPRQ